MAVKLTCPRCKTPLQVPTKMLGEYTQCPACQNRILIPPQLSGGSAGGSSAESHSGRSGVEIAASAGPPSAAPAPAAAGAGPRSLPVAGSAPLVEAQRSMPAAVWSDHAAAAPPSQRKVARFITADSAPSTVHLAANGELPKLHLTEGMQQAKAGPKTSGFNPLVLVGVASLSFCLCIVLLLADFGSMTVDTRQEAAVRRQLESYYNTEGPLASYQVHLREAQQARSRGDRQTEERHYRKVLDLLHAERDPRDRFRGLTGTPVSDKKLEELLATLLAGHASDGGDDGT
jgi:hypothetical protein